MAWFTVTDAAYEHWIPKVVQQPSWADCDCKNLDSTYVAEPGYLNKRFLPLSTFLSNYETINTKKPNTSTVIFLKKG